MGVTAGVSPAICRETAGCCSFRAKARSLCRSSALANVKKLEKSYRPHVYVFNAPPELSLALPRKQQKKSG